MAHGRKRGSLRRSGRKGGLASRGNSIMNRQEAPSGRTARSASFEKGHPISCECPKCRQVIHTWMPRPELFLLPRETLYALASDDVQATYTDMESIDLAHLPYSHCMIGISGDVVLRTRLHVAEMDTDQVFVDLPHSDEPLAPSRETGIEKVDNFNKLLKEWAHPSILEESRDWEIRFFFFDEKFYHTLARFTPTSPWRDLSKFDYSFDARPHGGPKLDENQKELARKSLELRFDAVAHSLRKCLIVLLATRNAIKVRTKDKLAALGIGKRKLTSNQKPLYTTTITLPHLPVTDSKGEPTGRTVSPHLRRGHIRQQAWGPRRSFHKAIWIEPMFVNADPSYVSSRVAYNTSIIPPTPSTSPTPTSKEGLEP